MQKRTIVNENIKPGSLLATTFKPGQIPAGIEGLEIVHCACRA